MTRLFTNGIVAACFAIMLLSAGLSKASTVLSVTLDEVLRGSEFVFEGRVVSQETRLSPVNGDPFTYFTFEVTDVIKGPKNRTEIELGFMGGRKGQHVLQVTDMVMPGIGEQGVYFVESLARQQVHPLFGWSQGHYLVKKDKTTGQDRVVLRRADPAALIQGPSVSAFKSSLRAKLEHSQ